MELSMWLMLLYIFLAGAVGGAVNALMTDNGFILPTKGGGVTGCGVSVFGRRLAKDCNGVTSRGFKHSEEHAATN